MPKSRQLLIESGVGTLNMRQVLDLGEGERNFLITFILRNNGRHHSTDWFCRKKSLAGAQIAAVISRLGQRKFFRKSTNVSTAGALEDTLYIADRKRSFRRDFILLLVFTAIS